MPYKLTVLAFAKKNIMLIASLLAALLSLVITPPSVNTLKSIDWRTLANLSMMLCVLSGFKEENIFTPLVKFTKHFKSTVRIALFLVFCVFFSSMFVTNDVSLLIFAPLGIVILKKIGKEKYTTKLLALQNIAAIRGSMLTPFGSPQNLFLFSKSSASSTRFMLHMAPLCALSALLLVAFTLIIFRTEKHDTIRISVDDMKEGDEKKQIIYLVLFVISVCNIVFRLKIWYMTFGIVMTTAFVTDRKTIAKMDWVLVLTFLCFFVFSSSIIQNQGISSWLSKIVKNREYIVTILLSQIISNLPATIILYPFCDNFAGLIYGADTAGLAGLVGSLANLINLRIYNSYYPGKSKSFIKAFMSVSVCFFALVFLPGLLLARWQF